MASSILAEIIAHKRREVAAARAARPLAQLEAELPDAPAVRGFRESLARRIDHSRPAVIAEIKRASPSKGLIREDFDPARHALDYADAGAACLSVLTDAPYFRGGLADLRAARASAGLPLLRKDFIIDRYQVVESRLAGADCILLIVAALTDSQLRELADCAAEIGLDVLVEVHNRAELDRAIALDCGMIGINNRDLRSFHTTLRTTFDLIPHVPPGRLLVTESGIENAEDLRGLMECGVFGFLIGEAFMRAANPGAALKNLLREALA
ncbi:MAG: indole-3-glycerol phosphate synthase TrpC [Gammaproteobacteria bacterium]|nr:indole-3-glycerol phosphate synthase TrpC [Gammaproteobacteria bacterium]